ncbi:MAG: alpha/beta hydrolase [Candidatus Nanopelagicales bacterium]|nr:alpha/beta hydrolase [Candidatus Nanopelagicales bacterium]MDZ4250431.1 alpha/beta hydrolase [Candidatus Nanopelagicales bacterium]
MALTGNFERIKSYDDTRIACATWGEGTPVVLSNGICCSDTYWTYMAPFLVENGCQVIFFDYRGHKRSGRPGNPNEVGVPCHARDLWAVADHFGVTNPILIGHSMGVQTIFEAYRQRPEGTRALVALAGPFEYPLDHLYMTPIGALLLDAFEFSWRYTPSAVRAVWRATGFDTRAIVKFSKLMMAISRQAPSDLVGEYFTNVSELDPLLVIQMFRGMQMHSARDILRTCQVPVLQISGGRDMLTPLPLQREMASLLPDVEFEVFEKCGHTLPVDEPDRCDDRVLEFINKLRANEPKKPTPRKKAQAPA